MGKLRTIDIQGKPYVMVHDRIQAFRGQHPDYGMESDLISHTEGVAVFKATIKDAQGRIIAVGHAAEKLGDGFINKTSHIENAETSAWGRALANLGIGIDESIASYEEVANAVKNQEGIKRQPIQQQPTIEQQMEAELKGEGTVFSGPAEPQPEERHEKESSADLYAEIITIYGQLAAKYGKERASEILYNNTVYKGKGGVRTTQILAAKLDENKWKHGRWFYLRNSMKDALANSQEE